MGAVFSMLGGIYFWFDRGLVELKYSEILAKIRFWAFL